jgi:hypothetical protein
MALRQSIFQEIPFIKIPPSNGFDKTFELLNNTKKVLGSQQKLLA